MKPLDWTLDARPTGTVLLLLVRTSRRSGNMTVSGLVSSADNAMMTGTPYGQQRPQGKRALPRLEAGSGDAGRTLTIVDGLIVVGSHRGRVSRVPVPTVDRLRTSAGWHDAWDGALAMWYKRPRCCAGNEVPRSGGAKDTSEGFGGVGGVGGEMMPRWKEPPEKTR